MTEISTSTTMNVDPVLVANVAAFIMLRTVQNPIHSSIIERELHLSQQEVAVLVVAARHMCFFGDETITSNDSGYFLAPKNPRIKPKRRSHGVRSRKKSTKRNEPPPGKWEQLSLFPEMIASADTPVAEKSSITLSEQGDK